MARTLRSLSPADGRLLAELPMTEPAELPALFGRARAAQAEWAALPTKDRARTLRRMQEALIDASDPVARTIADETGKPIYEALFNEVAPSVQMTAYFAREAPSALRTRSISLRLFKHRRSTLTPWPLGVVLVISPWNYPFMLPYSSIVMALVCGNAVVFKPSEITPLVGLKIQELARSAGLPEGLLQTAIGDGALGAELIRQKPDKVFFTGSVATGKKIMALAAESLTPVNLELGGKDPMIVLEDADLDFATSAAAWGGCSNSGQMCASVERLLVHESVAPRFTELLKRKLQALRPGADLGFITLPAQKRIYADQLAEARARNASFLLGGDFNADGNALRPTLIAGPGIEGLSVYREETFGPVIALATFRTPEDAVRMANDCKYGLTASIMTRDLARGRALAQKIEAGTVTVNEVSYTAGVGETPWGGVKQSGFGRTHSREGLLEYVNLRHVNSPRAGFLTFKSPWWFPYTPAQLAWSRDFLELYRASAWARVRAVPRLLRNFLRMLRKERRL